MDCAVCGEFMAPALAEMGLTLHPVCEDMIGREMGQRNDELKSQLMKIINWADRNSPRSQQLAIGPSEIGHECDQRVARILAGMPQINDRFDPWAGIVGTSIHTWMQDAVNRYLDDGYTDIADWLTEMRVYADDLISGSSDLYANGDVIDYKTADRDKIKQMRLKGVEMIPVHYRVQGHIYGLGQEKAGRPVRDIVLVFMARNGLIKDMYIWREPYDVDIALAALDRMYRLADELIAADLPESEKWNVIEMQPDNGCWYCPFYVDRAIEDGPDAIGCPGNNKSGEERRAKTEADFLKGLI